MKLQFEAPTSSTSGFRPDARLGDSVFEVISSVRSLRNLRATIMDVARYSGGSRSQRGILILDDPAISDSRLREEWIGLQSIFKPETLRNLAIVVLRKGAPDAIFGELKKDEGESIPEIIKHARQQFSSLPRRSRDSFYDILKILINQWIAGAGPQTSLSLCEIAGCTYPTVAAALRKLARHLIRHSDRRVELRTFPKDAWVRLVANADEVRQTQWFADSSGSPRSIESLLARFQKLGVEGAAIGGVPGAHRLYPALDIVGIPRLDITMDSRTRKPDITFLRQLDPGLKPVGSGESARVAIHFLHQKETFFQRDEQGILWADPVECLLDLHEMRFEVQAAEFLRSQVLRSI